MRSLRHLIPLLKPYRFQVILTTAGLIGLTAIELILPAIIREVIDVGLSRRESSFLVQAALLLLGLGVLRSMLASVLSTLLMFTSYFNAAGTLVALPFLLLFRAHRTRRHLIVGGAAYLCAGIAGVYVLMTHNPWNIKRCR